MPERVSLGWYRGFDGDALLAAPPQELRAGQRWRFTVRLRQPHGTLNPHGFDLELWLFEQGLRATGYGARHGGAPAAALADAAGHPVERARQAVRDAILLRVRRRRARPACWRRWRWATRRRSSATTGTCSAHTGVAHLMSISGLHVTMFAWLAGGADRPAVAAQRAR